ncbi:Ldh family oxidoreductase [Chloroflexota bacterium]
MLDKKGDIHIVQAESMKSFCIDACKKVGLSPEHAELVADHLVEADLRGVDSQGVTRFPRHIAGYQGGRMNPHPSIKVVKESGAIAVIDGDDGIGLVVSHKAMNLAMDKAAEYGTGTVTVRRSGHYGMAAYWSMMALERDMIGFTTTNAPPKIAPWGGVTASYGNNPISYAIPANREWPLVPDIAMSVAAMGKVQLAAMKNQALPPGWALDKNGEPTTDAQAAIEGLFVPIGEHKGYGMALVHDVLCGVLSGGSFSTDILKPQPGSNIPNMFSQFFMALDISHFMPVTEFKERIDRMVSVMKSSRLAKGQNRIYLPGEMEFETRRQRIKEGIPYPTEVIDQVRKLGRELNLPTDF